MNLDKTLLDLSLRLLIVQHGKARVSEALSAIEDADLSGIHGEIESCGNKATRTKAQRRPGKSIEETIRDAGPASPEAEGVIKKLARAYQSREFLPELRDVKRFLESRSTLPAARLRSRADAFPMVVRVLARCELDELYSLDRRRENRGGDLGVITDHLLGRGADYRRSV